jgi:glycosyltransferase involved in cell wall biosynthesis
MRLHVIGLPHTETTRAFEWCAYTSKVRKFCDMMSSLGHEVFLYAGEANEAAVTEHVAVISREEQSGWWGHLDWSRDVFPADGWDIGAPWWRLMNGRAIAAIRERLQSHDYICIIAGRAQQEIADAFPELIVVEWGIGYEGTFASNRVFESYAWAHRIAGTYGPDDVHYFDTVIPNSFEPEAFPLGRGDGGYFLFVGRLIPRKGPHIAAEVCRRIGAKLVLAGQGVSAQEPGRIVGSSGALVEGDVEHVGMVGPERRAELMGGARAVFVPTIYLEPFGGVAVEAMMTGTPVITTDWGAFTETVQQGVTGFRCRMLEEFVAATRRVDALDRAAIREYALSRYSISVVRHRYRAYFEQLETLWGEGWYSLPERQAVPV